MNNGANTTDGQPLNVDLGVTLSATQYTNESDSFGPDYDTGAEFPELELPVKVTVAVPSENGLTTQDVTMQGRDVKATVPAGVQLTDGAQALTLTVTEMETSDSGITTGETEDMVSLDVHIDGVAEGNTTPITVDLGPVMPKYLNMGNYELYHVENGTTNQMTMVHDLDQVDAHNEFYYDVNTGNLTVALATFSEVAVVADTENAWEGNFDYSWYTNPLAKSNEYTIANADQLAAFGAIVGGMNGQTQDSFAGKTVKLISDINLGDAEENNDEDKIFYPIGYNSSDGKYEKTEVAITSELKPFEGTFDGQGHTIANFYQNTWEMKGDDPYYAAKEQYYNDAMGLFGYVVNGTVKNLTVDHFSSDGEFTPTGVIAAYAVNSTFENIAITNCNPRVYNTGNGGIVGIGGNSDDPDTYKLTFNNITIDNTNKITALWGSWDVACGGLIGMFRGAGHVYMTNCHVAAQMDVYNDVCGNYQYYWYRYSGMMVGTNKNMITDKDGYTVPETDKFHAESCTVHFGEWNDYYYCELVDNSLASYTHDHQFSRLEQIQDVTAIQDANGNWNRTGNFILMNGKTPTDTCYHIINKDGVLKEHNHAEAGKETVDGVEVLKENNQRIYLPFNQLFTGYGWGVKHIPVYNGEDYAFEGITILDREVADSVEKFEGKVTELANNKEYKLGDIFAFVDNGVELKPATLTVSVTNLDENNPVSAIVEYDASNWEDGTLTLEGTGFVKITIQDYYFCTPTSIEVTVTERQSEEKFETKFTGEFLYRVGNQNAVALGSLFAAVEGAEIGTVEVNVEEVKGNASGAYTANTDWTTGTIKFSGTGVVKVTIQDYNFCTPTELYLEVVDATNHSSASISSLGSGNVVLLCDTKLNNNGALALQNASLYGNGFTVDVTAGRTRGESISANYLLYMNNATLDNTQVVGAVYTNFDVISSNEWNNPVILSVGDSTIANSYVANCASPVRFAGDKLTIINSTLKGGFFANVDVRGGNLVLDNVTTINQANLNDTAADGTEIAGMGIVVFYEGPSSGTTITVKNNLTQYNYLANVESKNSYANMLLEEIFESGKYGDFIYTDASGMQWANTGIISLYEGVDNDNIIITDQTNKNAYTGTSLSYSNSLLGGPATGYLYTTNPKTICDAYEFVPSVQYEVVPKVAIDHTINKVIKTDDSETSCTSDSLTDQENITFANGDSFEWDVNVLKSSNKKIAYTVWVDGVQYTDKVVFDESGTHNVVFKYSDASNYRKNGDAIEQYTAEYETSMVIVVSEKAPTAKSAEITFPLLNSYGTTKVAVDGKTYIMPNLTGTNIPKYGDDLTFDASTRKYGSLKADGKTSVDIYYPIVKTAISGNYMVFPVFGNKNGTLVQIVDYADNGIGEETTYNASTQTLPSGLSVSRGYTVQWATDKEVVGSGSMNYGSWTNGTLAFKYQSSSDTIACKVMSNYLSYYPDINLRSNDRNEQVMVAEYKYVDNKGDTYYYCVGYHIEERNGGYAFGETVPEQSGGGCVADGTMVTLADGSKKAVETVAATDELLVWDFYNGRYAAVPAAVVINHGNGDWDVISLVFDDGTIVEAVTAHAFFDAEANEFVLINAENAQQYIGHKFVKADGEGYATTKLVDCTVTKKYTGSYSLVSALHYNFIVEDMFSLTNLVPELLAGLEVGDNMTYDEAVLQADIQEYGLYTYEDFASHITQEQFAAFNAPYVKISVGKGYTTYEEIIDLIHRFVND